MGVSIWEQSIKDNQSHGADGVSGGRATDGPENAGEEDGGVMTRGCF